MHIMHVYHNKVILYNDIIQNCDIILHLNGHVRVYYAAKPVIICT